MVNNNKQQQIFPEHNDKLQNKKDGNIKDNVMFKGKIFSCAEIEGRINLSE